MRRSVIPLVLAGGLIAIAAALPACAPPVPTDSGVRGVVRIGPISPVQQQGQPGDAPYAAKLIVRTAGGSVAARTSSGADGVYRVDLAPGDYTIEGQSGATPPTPPGPTPFTVRTHAFTVVDLSYDSGIR